MGKKMKDLIERFKKHPKKALAVLAIVLFLVFFLWGRQAEAGEAGLGLGFGYSSNVGATYQELMVRTDARTWYGSLTRIGGDSEHNYHYWRGCGGYQVNWRRDKAISPYARLGACYFDKAPTDYISERLSYELAFGIRLWNVAEIDFDQHNSTAGRADDNEGIDAVMLRFVFPFGD